MRRLSGGVTGPLTERSPQGLAVWAKIELALAAILGVIPGIALSSLVAIRAVFLAFALRFTSPVAIALLKRDSR